MADPFWTAISQRRDRYCFQSEPDEKPNPDYVTYVHEDEMEYCLKNLKKEEPSFIDNYFRAKVESVHEKDPFRELKSFKGIKKDFFIDHQDQDRDKIEFDKARAS
jgi:hypothetical protein